MLACKKSLVNIHSLMRYPSSKLCSDFEQNSSVCNKISQSNFLKICKSNTYAQKFLIFTTWAYSWIPIEDFGRGCWASGVMGVSHQHLQPKSKKVEKLIANNKLFYYACNSNFFFCEN